MPRSCLVLSALALTAGALSFAANARELRSADVHNADDYPTVAAVKYMSELLSRNSKGAYTIKVFNKGALGSEKETIDQVKIGALDFTRVNISPMNAICQKTMVPRTPRTSAAIQDGKYEPATVMSGAGRQPDSVAVASRARSAPRCRQRRSRHRASAAAVSLSARSPGAMMARPRPC